MSFLNSSLTSAIQKIVSYAPTLFQYKRASTVKVIQYNATSKVIQYGVSPMKVITYTSDAIVLGR